MRQRLKIKEILPFLRQKPVLFDTEMDHIEESQPTEQGNVLVECLMNKGISGIEMLYLCLLESSEKADGVPSHYQLAVELKEIGEHLHMYNTEKKQNKLYGYFSLVMYLNYELAGEDITLLFTC